MSSSKPENIGILALDIYFPKTYISQQDLETYNQVSSGKYTIGLGQLGLAYVDDREDLYSIALTAVSNLMKKYDINPKSIGRLEVATETWLDHSKAAKTVLMQLFAESGNTDIEGIDCMNACYAGTNALFNSIAWIESSAWDGRYALVVAADIAEYAEGPARPTGGCGAVAMLVGPNAPLVLQSVRGSHFEHTYDFYKPDPTSPYPIVDGKFSNSCYLRSLDYCFRHIASKYQKKYGKNFTVDDFDYCLLHAPYNKLVQKGFARLLFNEFNLYPEKAGFEKVQQFKNMDQEKSYEDVTLEKSFVELSKASYQQKVAPSILLPQQLGNLYTASLYAGLCSFVSNVGKQSQEEQKEGKETNLLMFSYGSGLASSMFIFSLNQKNIDAKFTLSNMSKVMNLEARLQERTKTSCEKFTEVMKLRESLHQDHRAFEPQNKQVDDLFDGTFYLVKKDDKGRRYYEQKK